MLRRYQTDRGRRKKHRIHSSRRANKSTFLWHILSPWIRFHLTAIDHWFFGICSSRRFQPDTSSDVLNVQSKQWLFIENESKEYRLMWRWKLQKREREKEENEVNQPVHHLCLCEKMSWHDDYRSLSGHEAIFIPSIGEIPQYTSDMLAASQIPSAGSAWTIPCFDRLLRKRILNPDLVCSCIGVTALDVRS